MSLSSSTSAFSLEQKVCVCIPHVEVGLDKVLIYLEGEVARHNNLMNTSIDPDGKLVREEQLCRYGYTVHPHQDSATKAGEDRACRDEAKGMILGVDAFFDQQLVKGIDDC